MEKTYGSITTLNSLSPRYMEEAARKSEDVKRRKAEKAEHELILLKLAAAGDPEALGAVIAEYPKIAAKICSPQGLQFLIGKVNKNEPGSIIDAWRALLPGLADPLTRVYLLISLYTLIHALRMKKSADLIGRCEVCKGFFLRVRKDQKCCGHKCANLFRVRKWRDNYQEKYKQQRDKRAESAKGEEP
jgi:hypothetical protein